MKKCPFCAEEIQDAAVICRYCRSEQPPVAVLPAPTLAPEVVAPVTAKHDGTPTSAARLLVWGLGALAVLIVLAIIGAALSNPPTNSSGKAPGSSVTPRPSSKAPVTASREGPQPGVTLENFLRIREGMSHSEVAAILGAQGVEQSRVDLAGTTTVMYGWEGRGFGANMNAMFQDGRLVSKAQFGLK